MNFDFIPGDIRGKVTTDFLKLVKEDGSWSFASFNSQNDYQRHLYALFLKQANYNEDSIKSALYPFCLDVAFGQRDSYIDDIVHSVIVGIPNEQGNLLPIYEEAK